MKKIFIIVFVTLLFVSCSKYTYMSLAESSDYVFRTDSSFWSNSIYFDSFERIDNKIIFYDKNHKYAGEAFQTESSTIERNSFKKVEK